MMEEGMTKGDLLVLLMFGSRWPNHCRFTSGCLHPQRVTINLPVLDCLNGDLLLCISRCLCKENGVRNRALHSPHWNGLSSEWVCRRQSESGELRIDSDLHKQTVALWRESGKQEERLYLVSSAFFLPSYNATHKYVFLQEKNSYTIKLS